MWLLLIEEGGSRCDCQLQSGPSAQKPEILSESSLFPPDFSTSVSTFLHLFSSISVMLFHSLHTCRLDYGNELSWRATKKQISRDKGFFLWHGYSMGEPEGGICTWFGNRSLCLLGVGWTENIKNKSDNRLSAILCIPENARLLNVVCCY